MCETGGAPANGKAKLLDFSDDAKLKRLLGAKLVAGCCGQHATAEDVLSALQRPAKAFMDSHREVDAQLHARHVQPKPDDLTIVCGRVAFQATPCPGKIPPDGLAKTRYQGKVPEALWCLLLTVRL